MAASVKEWADPCAFPDIENTNAFRSVEFVPRYRQEINAEFFNFDRNFASSLNRVRMEVDLPFLSNSANLLNCLDRTDFVVLGKRKNTLARTSKILRPPGLPQDDW